MSSKALLLLLVASAIAVTAALNPESHHPLQLTLVGFIDGRTFFTDTVTSAKISWSAAAARCRAAGLEPAEISTEAQYTFLMVNLPGSSTNTYWTAGKYSISDYLNRLGWNDGASNGTNVERCLYVQRPSHVITTRCTAVHFPLCHV